MSVLHELYEALGTESSDDAVDLTPTAVRAICRIARDAAHAPDRDSRVHALNVADRLGPPHRQDIALYFADDVDRDLRERVFAIGIAEGTGGLQILRKMSSDPDPALSVRALRTLTEAKDTSSTVVVRKHLSARHAVVRAAACDFLGLVGGVSLTPAIGRLLDDSDQGVRQAAARAIARIEGTEIPDTTPQAAPVPQIADAAPAPEPAEAAPESVAEAAPEPAPEPATQAAPEPVAEAAPEPVAEAAPAPAPAPEPEPAPEPAPQPVAAVGPTTAPEILTALGAGGVVSELMQRLAQCDERERSGALRSYRAGGKADLHVGIAIAAGHLGGTRWASQIRRMVTDSEPRVRAAAAAALGQVGTNATLPSLAQLLDDGEPSVRAATLSALATASKRLRADDWVQRGLAALGEDKSPEVVEARRTAKELLEG